MTIRIRLVGCSRYSYGPKGEVFEKGYEYDLDDEKAGTLLRSNDDRGMPFFARVERPAAAMQDTVIEETTGEGVGGVRIVRKRAQPVRNPKVRTAGDTTSLEAEDRREPASAGDEGLDDEGVPI